MEHLETKAYKKLLERGEELKKKLDKVSNKLLKGYSYDLVNLKNSLCVDLSIVEKKVEHLHDTSPDPYVNITHLDINLDIKPL